MYTMHLKVHALQKKVMCIIKVYTPNTLKEKKYI